MRVSTRLARQRPAHNTNIDRSHTTRQINTRRDKTARLQILERKATVFEESGKSPCSARVRLRSAREPTSGRVVGWLGNDQRILRTKTKHTKPDTAKHEGTKPQDYKYYYMNIRAEDHRLEIFYNEFHVVPACDKLRPTKYWTHIHGSKLLFHGDCTRKLKLAFQNATDKHSVLCKAVTAVHAPASSCSR